MNMKSKKKVMPSSRYILLLLAALQFVFITLRAAEYPQRIISLAPNLTEIIFGIGVGDRLVGRTDFCKFPAAAEKVASIGGYLNTDYEKVVRLHPDLIMMLPNHEMKAKFESLGVRVAEIPDETIGEILSSITTVGKLLGEEENARLLRRGIEDTLQMISKESQSLPDTPRAVFVVGREAGSLTGLYLAGKNTYLSQLWERCGGRNAFDDVSTRYFSVNEEDMLKRQIDFILEFHPGWDLTPQRIDAERRVWQVFGNIRAVKNSNIFLFSDLYFVTPGPRISRIAMKFWEIIKNSNAKHPE